MPSNEHHEWFKKCHWPAVYGAMYHPDRDLDLLKRKYKERDDHGRLPHHWFAEKAQTHTHTLAYVGVTSICLNEEALITRDKEGETPIDIARRSGACAKIIGLLSLTPEEVRSLDGEGMRRLYAPMAHWTDEMARWIESRSYADCHKFINEHDDELVREVLKYDNSHLLFQVACFSQVYSDSLVFLALRMIHRNPPSLTTRDPLGQLFVQYAEHPQFNACNEIRNVLRLTPKYISSIPFPTLLLQSLPTKHHEIYGPYNTVCQFIKHMKYDKAELTDLPSVLNPARKCDVCSSSHPTKSCSRCKHTFYCSPSCQKLAWKKHKKKCTPSHTTCLPTTEADLRTLHKGVALLNMCIQRPGAGDGPTSVVLEFLGLERRDQCIWNCQCVQWA